MTASDRSLARRSVVDELADALRVRILDGDLAPATPLRELVLSDTYSVSRHTLRAALRTLSVEGLVRISPNRGASVAALDPVALGHLFELRTALELEAAHLALVRHGQTLPSRVHRALAALTAACRARNPDWKRVADAHAAFHVALVAASESPRLEHAYGQLAAELRLFLVQLRPVWPLQRMITHHEDLVVALEAGNLPALRRHLEDGLDAVGGLAPGEAASR